MLLGVCEVGLCPNPPGALPLDPATFEKVDETFTVKFICATFFIYSFFYNLKRNSFPPA